MRRGAFKVRDLDLPQVSSSRSDVVHEAASKRVIINVIDDFFVQTAAYALCDTTFDLASHDQRVNYRSGVFDSYIPKKFDLTSLSIDLDGDKVSSVGMSRRNNRVILTRYLQSRLYTGRRSARRVY